MSAAGGAAFAARLQATAEKLRDAHEEIQNLEEQFQAALTDLSTFEGLLAASLVAEEKEGIAKLNAVEKDEAVEAATKRVEAAKDTKKKLWDHMFRALFFLEDIEGKEHCVGVALEADATQLVAEHVGLFPDMKSFMLETMADEISRLSKDLEEAKAAAEQMMVAAAAVGAGPEEAREAALAQDRVKALVHDKYVADAANLLMDRAMEAVRESMEEATETKRIATEWKGAVFDAGGKDKIDYNAYAQALAELAAAKKLLPKAKAAADEAQGQLAAAEAERAVKGAAAQEAAPKLSPAIVTIAKLFAALVCAKAEG